MHTTQCRVVMWSCRFREALFACHRASHYVPDSADEVPKYCTHADFKSTKPSEASCDNHILNNTVATDSHGGLSFGIIAHGTINVGRQ